MSTLVAVLHSSVVHAGLIGLAGAVGPDLHAFLQWKSVNDATNFSWRNALLHYAQGIIGGMVATPMLSALFGI